MEMNYFCYICGEYEYKKDITKDFDNILKNGIKCNYCENTNRYKDTYYPKFTVNDFLQTTIELYEQDKNHLGKSINSSYEVFKNLCSKDSGVSYEKYEEYYYYFDKLLENKTEYSIDLKSKVLDDLEDELVKSYSDDTAIALVTSFTSIKTPYRKPLLILIASTIELLFNIYFEEVCSTIEPSPRQLKSIPQKIEYLDLKNQMKLEQLMKTNRWKFLFGLERFKKY